MQCSIISQFAAKIVFLVNVLYKRVIMGRYVQVIFLWSVPLGKRVGWNRSYLGGVGFLGGTLRWKLFISLLPLGKRVGWNRFYLGGVGVLGGT